MIMITGGAFQGKRNFAREKFNFSENDIISGRDCEIDRAFSAECLADYHLLIRRVLDEKMDALEFTQSLCERNPNAVIIIDEIGCGIIPIEKNERIWREQVGRAGCMIASNSSVVVRICCGIPAVIKGGLV